MMQEPEKPVASPCMSLCALDEDDICVGCQRSAAEITAWTRLDNHERRQVLARCIERGREKGVFFS